MGQVGIGTPTIWHINSLNPANLVYNQYSTFQVGIQVDRRVFSGQDISGEDIAGGLRSLAYAFPVMKGTWSSAISVLPYSSVNFNTFSNVENVGGQEGVNGVSDNRGEGGLTNFTWSHGFKIKNKFLVGIKANYTFGSITKTETTSIAGVDVPFITVTSEEQESYSDLNFLLGFAYTHQVSDKKFLNFGLTYSPRSQLNGTSEISLIRIDDGNEIENVEIGSDNIDFNLPQSVGFGFSFQKFSHYSIGFDLEYNSWSDAGTANQVYNDAINFSLGGFIIPDYDNVNSYWKRITYSAGLNYQRLPYIVNNQSLIDFGINFGASFPVSGISSVDLGLKAGRLGESTNGLVEETYYRVVFGVTINDRWFIKRKYD